MPCSCHLQDQGHDDGRLVHRAVSSDIFVQLSRLCSDNIQGLVESKPLLVELKLRAKRAHRSLLQLSRTLNSSHIVDLLQRFLRGRGGSYDRLGVVKRKPCYISTYSAMV